MRLHSIIIICFVLLMMTACGGASESFEPFAGLNITAPGTLVITETDGFVNISTVGSLTISPNPGAVGIVSKITANSFSFGSTGGTH